MGRTEKSFVMFFMLFLLGCQLCLSLIPSFTPSTARWRNSSKCPFSNVSPAAQWHMCHGLTWTVIYQQNVDLSLYFHWDLLCLFLIYVFALSLVIKLRAMPHSRGDRMHSCLTIPWPWNMGSFRLMWTPDHAFYLSFT